MTHTKHFKEWYLKKYFERPNEKYPYAAREAAEAWIAHFEKLHYDNQIGVYMEYLRSLGWNYITIYDRGGTFIIEVFWQSPLPDESREATGKTLEAAWDKLMKQPLNLHRPIQSDN